MHTGGFAFGAISIKSKLSFLAFPIASLKVKIPKLENQTPWQEISRKMVGQLETGACLETESLYLDITNTKGMPRHSH